MDPSFLFAGVRFDRKRFAADVNRFKVLFSWYLQTHICPFTRVCKVYKVVVVFFFPINDLKPIAYSDYDSMVIFPRSFVQILI